MQNVLHGKRVFVDVGNVTAACQGRHGGEVAAVASHDLYLKRSQTSKTNQTRKTSKTNQKSITSKKRKTGKKTTTCKTDN